MQSSGILCCQTDFYHLVILENGRGNAEKKYSRTPGSICVRFDANRMVDTKNTIAVFDHRCDQKLLRIVSRLREWVGDAAADEDCIIEVCLLWRKLF
jgi:hypothetical protein